jgi:transcription elongation factor GreA
MIDVKKKIQDEIAALEHEFRTELPKEILRARELGDLSENAEYHAAKERQGYVNARLGQLKLRLQALAMVDITKIPMGKVGLGSTVVVLDVTKEEEITYKLVTSEEADVANGLISTSSPIGKGLLHKEVGDEVKVSIPGGIKHFEILRLRTIHEIEDLS